MFFLKKLEYPIHLHPSYFGPAMLQFLEQKLRDDVEGTCDGRYGYIVKVVAIDQLGDGTVIPGTGLAEFNATYRAIVLKPFRNEVVDALVTNVSKVGVFAELGPLRIFVSTHLLPPHYKFQPDSNPPEFVAQDQVAVNLVKGTKVRLRIVGSRMEATEIFAIGTMKEDYLGPFD